MFSPTYALMGLRSQLAPLLQEQVPDNQ
jgi:hypothetical protein